MYIQKKTSALILLCGLLLPTQETKPVSFNVGVSIDIPLKYIVGITAVTYAVGNIYARLIERATHYRFDDEMSHLQHINPSESVVQEMLQAHNHHLNKSFFSCLREQLQLLPTACVEEELAVFPFVQHRRDLDSYLGSLWWSQFWTVFTQKYRDLAELRVCLQQLRNIIITDYRYTQELQRLSHYP